MSPFSKNQNASSQNTIIQEAQWLMPPCAPIPAAMRNGTIPAAMSREQQKPALQIWRVLQGRAAREWQQALLHQPVGHVLAPLTIQRGP